MAIRVENIDNEQRNFQEEKVEKYPLESGIPMERASSSYFESLFNGKK